MIGKLFATGITVRYGYSGSKYGWWARVDFQDYGHCQDGSVMGRIRTKYAGDLNEQIDVILNDAHAMGIEFTMPGGARPMIWYLDDGITDSFPPPAGWREMLSAAAQRIGFEV